MVFALTHLGSEGFRFRPYGGGYLSGNRRLRGRFGVAAFVKGSIVYHDHRAWQQFRDYVMQEPKIEHRGIDIVQRQSNAQQYAGQQGPSTLTRPRAFQSPSGAALPAWRASLRAPALAFGCARDYLTCHIELAQRVHIGMYQGKSGHPESASQYQFCADYLPALSSAQGVSPNGSNWQPPQKTEPQFAQRSALPVPNRQDMTPKIQ